jgi:hypothetical protein
MIAAPAVTPLTNPVAEPTPATEVLPLLHVPPVVTFPNVELAPIHTVVAPVIEEGRALTVTSAVVAHPPDIV